MLARWHLNSAVLCASDCHSLYILYIYCQLRPDCASKRAPTRVLVFTIIPI